MKIEVNHVGEDPGTDLTELTDRMMSALGDHPDADSIRTIILVAKQDDENTCVYGLGLGGYGPSEAPILFTDVVSLLEALNIPVRWLI